MKDTRRFLKEAKILLDAYNKNQIFDFRDLKAKVLVRAHNVSDELYESLKYSENESELKNDIEDFLQERIILDESKSVLHEANEEEVEMLDKITLFSDLTSAGNNIQEAFNSVYPYKFQMVENPDLRDALSGLRVSISETMKKLENIISFLGLENDRTDNN